MSPLIFVTPQQGMLFAEHNAPYAQAQAHQLTPGTPYDVFLVIENTTSNEIRPTPTPAKVQVTTSAYGIGYPGGVIATVIINQVIPPHGQTTVQFEFIPEAGHACLYAKIINTDGSSGPSVQQNTDATSLPAGAANETPFFVYGALGSPVSLEVTEFVDNGSGTFVPLNNPATDSWQPKLRAADPQFGSTAPTPATHAHPVVISNLTATGSATTLLQVTPKAGALAHKFHVEGFVNGNSVGQIDQIVNVGTPGILPDPYVLGGYQSHSILLKDLSTNTYVPWGGAPGGVWDTLLRPSTNYGFSARVFNAAPTPAHNTIVRFWWCEGGVGTICHLLDTQLVTVPAAIGFVPGSVLVTSNVPFPSAPQGTHRCAAVSIYNSLSGCKIDATHDYQIPDPGQIEVKKCSAWRNSDSMFIFWPINKWKFTVALGPFNPKIGPGPVELVIDAKYVPLEWNQNQQVLDMTQALAAAGARNDVQFYLLPGLNKTIGTVDLGIKVPDARETKGNVYVVDYNEKVTDHEITGTLPKGAKNGDTILVNVTANYKATKDAPAKSVSFMQVMHLTDQKQ